MICLTPKPSESFFVYRIQSKKKKKLQKKQLFKNKKRKEGFFTGLATTIKKNPTRLIRKPSNELKVHEKTKDSN